jgi:hypothetical protein
MVARKTFTFAIDEDLKAGLQLVRERDGVSEGDPQSDPPTVGRCRSSVDTNGQIHSASSPFVFTGIRDFVTHI